MKKLFLAIASLFLLASCSTNVEVKEPHRLNNGDDVTVYLNLTETGLIDGNPGTDIEEVYINNGYKLETKVGEALPDATRITSTSAGVTFGGWYVYEEKLNPGVPTIYEIAPTKTNMILQAFWTSDNTPGGGNQGGGGTTPDTPASTNKIYIDVTALSWWNNGNASTYAYTWNNASPLNGTWPGQYLTKEGSMYVINVPTTATHIIVSRVNPSVQPSADGAVWNQTVDIPMQSGKNKLSLTSDAKNNEGKLTAYTWSTYTA